METLSPITLAALPEALPTITISCESHSTLVDTPCWQHNGNDVVVHNNVTNWLALLERRMDQFKDWMSKVDEWRRKDEEWKNYLLDTLKMAAFVTYELFIFFYLLISHFHSRTLFDCTMNQSKRLFSPLITSKCVV